MKKLKVLFLGVLLFSITNVNATSLDCSSTLKVGDEGEKVQAFQQVLNDKQNCGLKMTGYFGEKTKACVLNYQKKHNLEEDGVVGPNTCNMLNGTSAIMEEYEEQEYKRGIVIVDEANIRKEATTESSVIGRVKLGAALKIVDHYENGWYKIVSKNNYYGYIKDNLITLNCIMVDISDQKLYVYENGQRKWGTKVITGKEGKHDTPKGHYILKKSNLKREKILRGTEDDGTEYASHVDYWMPFNGGVGFHGASWRKYKSFNTETYKKHGSHGCVNMQYDAAERLYNSITDNMDVVVRN